VDDDGRTGTFPSMRRSFPPTTRKRVGIYLEREKTNMRIYKKKAIAVVIVLRDKRGGAIEKKTKCRRADGDSNK